MSETTGLTITIPLDKVVVGNLTNLLDANILPVLVLSSWRWMTYRLHQSEHREQFLELMIQAA